jgi:exosome complex component RRP42
LIDASALSAIAALNNVSPPRIKDWTLPEFPLVKKPIAVTIAKIGDKLMVDPSLEEESVMDARLTITTIEDGSICAMQKGGIGFFTLEELEEAYALAREKAEELRRHVG